MAFGKLYAMRLNPRSDPPIAIAKANNLDIEIIETHPLHTGPEYLKVNRLGKVPTFIGSDDFVLHETIAICIYFASQNEKTTLLGKTKQDYASILKWMSFVNSDVAFAVPAWQYPFYGPYPYNKKDSDEALKKTLHLIKTIEEALADSTYLVGERLTIADLFTACFMRGIFRYKLDKKWRDENPNTTRWYLTVINQPLFSDSCESFPLIDEAIEYQPPKKENMPKAAPEKTVKQAEEAEPVAEPKPKHPLDALPKPSLALDEWKRQYSNNETPQALKWFWEKYNPDEYSLWKLDYKYNNELTQVFMSSNLIGGFFTRLEASRKFIFGAASVYGEKDNSVIQGAFVIRGQDALPAIDVAPDYESYEFTKLDPTKDEDRNFVNDQWTWEKPITVNGKEYPWADGKVFK